MKKTVDKHIEKLLDESFFIYLLEKWKISSGEHLGKKFSFVNRPYMVEYAKDMHPFKVTMKSAQCGISELNVAVLLNVFAPAIV